MTGADDPNGELEMLKRDAWNWVLRLTSGEATKADIIELERWCAQSPRHAEAFSVASGRWRAFGPAIENVVQEGVAASRSGARAKPLLGRRAFLGGAVAAAGGAAIAIVRPPLGLWPSISDLTADYRTAPGEQRKIALTDNATVQMNTRTSLNLLPKSDHSDGIELIAGEATIATRSKVIEVIAGTGRVSADAAKFNVRYDAPNVCVTCLEGLVQVTQDKRLITIQQNQQITYAAHGFGQLTTVDAAVVTGWRDGDLYFQDEPLSRVIDEVNRYRLGRIVLMNDALGQRRFTARFKLDRLEVVVTQLQATFGARVASLPGGIVLIS